MRRRLVPCVLRSACGVLALVGCGAGSDVAMDASSDGATDVDAMVIVDTPPPVPSSFCALAAQNAKVSGMTPLGFVSFPASDPATPRPCDR